MMFALQPYGECLPIPPISPFSLIWWNHSYIRSFHASQCMNLLSRCVLSAQSSLDVWSSFITTYLVWTSYYHLRLTCLKVERFYNNGLWTLHLGGATISCSLLPGNTYTGVIRSGGFTLQTKDIRIVRSLPCTLAIPLEVCCSTFHDLSQLVLA